MQVFNSLCIIRAVRNPKKQKKMDKSRFYAMALLMPVALLSTVSCDNEDGPDDPPVPVVCPTSSTTRAISESSNDMAFPLFDKVCAEKKPTENIIVSPLSLTEVLVMLSNGAKGETLNQIKALLGTKDISLEDQNSAMSGLNQYLIAADSKTSVAIANSQWIDDEFKVKDEYIQTNTKWLNAETRNQDLATEKTMNDINSWCDKNTQGCIKKLLDEPLSEDCRLALINALYFKGMWSKKFDKGNTTDEDFTNSDGSKKKVKMMHQTEVFSAYEGKNMDMVEFAYGDKKFCMDVILPHEGKNLDECMKDFSSKTFSAYVNDSYGRDVVVSMPRMELKFKTSLVQPLMNMGMTLPFSNEFADFTGISDHRVFIDEIIQATYVKMDEEGTEAAAVTAAFANDCTSIGSEPTPLIFNMNRPFVFIIREKDSNTILFMGKVRIL